MFVIQPYLNPTTDLNVFSQNYLNSFQMEDDLIFYKWKTASIIFQMEDNLNIKSLSLQVFCLVLEKMLEDV